MDDQGDQKPTPQEAALIAAHAQRAAELRIQLDLLVLRSLIREIKQRRPFRARALRQRQGKT